MIWDILILFSNTFRTDYLGQIVCKLGRSKCFINAIVISPVESFIDSYNLIVHLDFSMEFHFVLGSYLILFINYILRVTFLFLE